MGAGPGDPELLTLKACACCKTADAVLHDDLVAPEILKLIPATAQVHNVGKRCGKKKILQEEINFLMVALADSGLRVVRLKSGDPLIFGRAGEEIESLRRANIPFEIVPGVTSAMGAAAAAQIPLTHRRASSALVFLTAHQAPGSEAANWSKLAGSGATLVIYMPGQNYSEVAAKLKCAGLAGEHALRRHLSRDHSAAADSSLHDRRVAPVRRNSRRPLCWLWAKSCALLNDPAALAQQFRSAQFLSATTALPLLRRLQYAAIRSQDFGSNEEPLA